MYPKVILARLDRPKRIRLLFDYIANEMENLLTERGQSQKPTGRGHVHVITTMLLLASAILDVKRPCSIALLAKAESSITSPSIEFHNVECLQGNH